MKTLLEIGKTVFDSALFGDLEIWTHIPSFENYYSISNFGNVKSLEREIKLPNGITKNLKSIALKPKMNTKGYLRVILNKNGIRKEYSIHRLMAMTFLNHRDTIKGIVVDHKDNDKTNNNISNLQLITHRENCSKDRKSKLGVRNIRLNKYNGFEVQLWFENRLKSLGTYKNINEAITVRDNFINKHFKETGKLI